MSILLDKNPCLEIIVLDEEVILFTSLCFIVKPKKKNPTPTKAQQFSAV